MSLIQLIHRVNKAKQAYDRCVTECATDPAYFCAREELELESEEKQLEEYLREMIRSEVKSALNADDPIIDDDEYCESW